MDEAAIRQGVACILAASPTAGRSLNTTLSYLDTIKGKNNNQYSSGMVRLGGQTKASNEQLGLSCI